jgi:hypothetical protein
MQAIWRLLLDEKFVEAYHSGLVIKFVDGIKRRAFPRFYTYGADYPEKYALNLLRCCLLLISNPRILLACIKFLGLCLCPRCLVEKKDVSKMGTTSDMATRGDNIRIDDQSRKKKILRARKYIFKRGVGVNGVRIKELLADESLVPTEVHFKHSNISKTD